MHQVITSPVRLPYANLQIADIEIHRVWKGLHHDQQQTRHLLTKLFSAAEPATADAGTGAGSRQPDQCGRFRSLPDLQLGQPYVHFGRFHEGRLFLTGCDYAQRLVQLRRVDRQWLDEPDKCAPIAPAHGSTLR